MTKLAHRGLIRCRLTPQVNTDEMAQGARIVQGFFYRWVGQVEPVLQKMNSQHAFQAHRWAARTCRFGIKRLNDLAPPAPRNNLFHLREKLVPAGGFELAFRAFISERLLAHSTNLQVA